MLAPYRNAANLVTLLGLGLGVAACLLSFRREPGLALVALMGAGIADLFDGFLARRTKRTPQAAAFGVQLDSLADMASFGLVPAVLCMHLGLDSAFDLGLLGVYVCCAAIRLAHFNVTAAPGSGPRTHYTGLPVTFAALFFPIIVLARGVMTPDLADHALRATVAVMAVAFVSNVRIPKPGGAFYFVLPALALGLTVLCLTQPVLS